MKRRDILTLIGVAIASGLTFMAGCGVPAATWISLATSLLATVLPTIPALIQTFGTLVGKNIITAAQQAKLQQIFTGVQDLLNQANAGVTQFEASGDVTLLSKIKTILGQVKTSLSSVITDVGITDPATVAKITLMANSQIDLADNILAVLPVVSGGKLMAKKVTKEQMQKVTAKAWAAKFNAASNAPSGNKDIDDAFTKVKAVVRD